MVNMYEYFHSYFKNPTLHISLSLRTNKMSLPSAILSGGDQFSHAGESESHDFLFFISFLFLLFQTRFLCVFLAVLELCRPGWP